MESKQLNLENLIKQALEEEANRIRVPSSDKVWDNIVKKNKGNSMWFMGKLAAAYFIIVLLVTTIYFKAPAPVNAFNTRIFKIVVDMFRSQPPPADISVSMSNKSPLPPDAPPPPPDWPLATGERVISLEQAESEASFKFVKPSYLPKGLELDIITILNKDTVTQYYRSDKNRLIIRQQYIPGDFASNSFFSNAEIKKVDINGNEGTLIKQYNPYTKKDRISVLWFIDNVRFKVESDLSEREILKIVCSLK